MAGTAQGLRRSSRIQSIRVGCSRRKLCNNNNNEQQQQRPTAPAESALNMHSHCDTVTYSPQPSLKSYKDSCLAVAGNSEHDLAPHFHAVKPCHGLDFNQRCVPFCVTSRAIIFFLNLVFMLVYTLLQLWLQNFLCTVMM